MLKFLKRLAAKVRGKKADPAPSVRAAVRPPAVSASATPVRPAVYYPPGADPYHDATMTNAMLFHVAMASGSHQPHAAPPAVSVTSAPPVIPVPEPVRPAEATSGDALGAAVGGFAAVSPPSVSSSFDPGPSVCSSDYSSSTSYDSSSSYDSGGSSSFGSCD